MIRADWIRLQNFKCFVDTGEMALGAINVLVGENNAGKSTFIQALRSYQIGGATRAGQRIGAPEFTITARFSGSDTRLFRSDDPLGNTSRGLDLRASKADVLTTFFDDSQRADRLVYKAAETEPDNVFYYYLSRRKTQGHDEEVNRRTTQHVTDDLRNLTARVASLSNPELPAHTQFQETMRTILGFTVAAIPSEHGQKVGRSISRYDDIPLEEMGEGVTGLVALIATLCLAEGRIILMEEPENDLHPKALKTLLDLMIRSSTEGGNQIVVTTHSNIVVRHLGAAPDNRLLRVRQSSRDGLGVSTIDDVTDDLQARHAILRELGYELFDLGLHEGWLIFEEASAEGIVRDYLIPWFHPYLSRVRTLATPGAGGVQPAFEELRRMFLFSHLEEMYRNRTCVLVDGDETGQQVVSRLRGRFSTWEPDRFQALEQPDFERYYPVRFRAQADEALALPDKRAKRTAKAALVQAVRDWCDANDDEAREEFAVSAREVIDHLARMEMILRGEPDVPAAL